MKAQTWRQYTRMHVRATWSLQLNSVVQILKVLEESGLSVPARYYEYATQYGTSAIVVPVIPDKPLIALHEHHTCAISIGIIETNEILSLSLFFFFLPLSFPFLSRLLVFSSQSLSFLIRRNSKTHVSALLCFCLST